MPIFKDAEGSERQPKFQEMGVLFWNPLQSINLCKDAAQNQLDMFCALCFGVVCVCVFLSRIVRGQTPESLRLHNVTFCREHYAEWEAAALCPVPQFSGKEPSVRVNPGAF